MAGPSRPAWGRQARPQAESLKEVTHD